MRQRNRNSYEFLYRKTLPRRGIRENFFHLAWATKQKLLRVPLRKTLPRRGIRENFLHLAVATKQKLLRVPLRKTLPRRGIRENFFHLARDVTPLPGAFRKFSKTHPKNLHRRDVDRDNQEQGIPETLNSQNALLILP